MCFAMLLVYYFKPFHFYLLPIEDLNDVHARNVFLQEGVEAGNLCAHVLKRGADAVLKDVGGHKQKRNGGEGDKGQFPIYIKHNGNNGYQLEDVSENDQNSVREDVGNCLNVRNHAGYKRADGCFIEILKLKMIDVVVNLGADVFDNALPQPVGTIGVEIIGNGLYDEHTDNDQRHKQQPIRIGRYDVIIKRVLNEHGPQGR